jgi:predicted acyltransferase (DUF342 family)
MPTISSLTTANTVGQMMTKVNQLVTRTNYFSVDGSKLYANTVYANVALNALGTLTVTGLTTASGRLVVGTNLSVTGNSALGNAVNDVTTITGSTTISDKLTVSGNTTLGNAVGDLLAVTGSVTITDKLTVNGNTAFGNAVGDRTTITGSVTISDKLTVNGNTAFGDAVGDVTTITGTLAAGGRLTVASNLSVTGNTTLGNAVGDRTTITGSTTISDKLTVNGNTALGNANTDVVSVTGTLAAAGRLTVGTNLEVTGNTTLGGTVIDQSNALAQTLSDGANITWNMNSGKVATITLGGNRNLDRPTNMKIGTYILHVVQDATGSRTLSYSGVYKWPGAVAPTLTTTGSRRDIIMFICDGTSLYGSYLNDVR